MLYQTITKCMTHSPCGPEHPNASCMVDGVCSKHFPKEFCPETRFSEDGYPEYARPDNGRTYTNSRGQTFDNCHIIPYNPFLSARYDCHINVEICTSVKAIKYIHKYIYKGHDPATLEVSEIDEILEHIDSHYIGPPEGVWHVLEFPLHEEKPSVYHLPVHLKDQQMVFFDDDNVEEVMGCNSITKTRLTEWFTANRTLEGAKAITYQDFPQDFTWDKKAKKWNIRWQCNVIGRMYFAHLSAGERFYLRLLLTIVKGLESWEDLRTVDGQVHLTFKAALSCQGSFGE
jgi:hypothetical protein